MKSAEVSGETSNVDVNLTLGPEWAALEVVARGLAADAQTRALDSILSTPGFDYDTLLGLSVRNNLAPALASALKRTDGFKSVPDSLRDHLILSHHTTRYRSQILTREASNIAKRARQSDIPIAFTKGVILQFLAYGGDGTRPMSDIDMMVHEDHASAIDRILGEMGYLVCDYDDVNDELFPLSREWRIRYAMSPDHLPPRMKLNDNLVCPVFMIDTAMSLTWAKSEWQVDMSDVMARVCEYKLSHDSGSRHESSEVSSLPSLSVAHTWLFTVLHLFREAWIRRTADEQRTTLSQFRDVLRTWMNHGRAISNEVRQIVERDRIEFPVAWVIQHTDALLGSTISDELNLSVRLSESDLAGAIGPTGDRLTWTGSMRQRLYSADRPSWAEDTPKCSKDDADQ